MFRPAWILAAVFLGGCASVQKDAGFGEVQKLSAARTGQTVEWNSGSSDDQAIASKIHTMLAAELSVDKAVQIALLNNRNIQVTYEGLGIAQADLVQAGLLKNPVFSVSARFPDGGGGTNLELGVTQQFIDILTLPMRRKLAAAKFETEKLRVAGSVVALANDTRAAYFQLQGAEQMLELRRTVVEASAASYEATKRIHEAGNITDLNRANEQAMYEQARLDLARAEAEVADDREKLGLLLGLWGRDSAFTVAKHLPDLPSEAVKLEGLESIAVANRLDLLAAAQEVQTTAQSLGIAKNTALFSEAEIGVDGEHDAGGGWLTGPNVSVPIPIFDGGQASTARARGMLRQSRQRYRATAVEVRSQVRMARNHLQSARQRADFLRNVVLPLRQQILDKTQLEYNGMLIGVFQLIAAKQAQINAGQEYVESIRDYWLARVELERGIGTSLSEVEPPGTMPAMPAPAKATMVPAPHHHQSK